MSMCIKDLYDNELVKKCYNFGKIQMKINLFKKYNKKDSLQSQFIICIKHYQSNIKEKRRIREKKGGKQM